MPKKRAAEKVDVPEVRESLKRTDLSEHNTDVRALAVHRQN
jgi:hypothetical protein